jgi:signal peptidase II
VRFHLPAWPGLLASGAVLTADQVTKLAISHYRDHLPYKIIGGLRIEYTQNTGVSFSLFSGQAGLLIVIVGIVTVAVLVGLLATPRRYAVPLGLILGGSLGNWVDRVRLGYVVDFVTAPHWPTFNVADVGLVAGMALLAVMVLWPQRRTE